MTVADRGPAVNLEELRSELAGRVAILPLIGAVCMAIWLTAQREPLSFLTFGIFAGLLALGGGVWLLMRLHSRLARHALVWGLTLTLLAYMRFFPAVWLPFAGISVIFVSAMVISNGEFAMATLIALYAAVLVRNDGRFYPLSQLLVALTVAAILARLVVRTLYTALEWAWTMQRRADQLLELARDRQGELSRTMKALDNGNIILRRTQRELIAARKQAEEARLMKEQFAANVSHELRTPLNLILGFSQMMSLSTEVYGNVDWPPTLRQDINQVYRSARHLLDLIDDVLDLSRFEIAGFALDKHPTPIAPLLSETIQMASDLFQGHAVRLESEIADDLPVLKVDRIRIRQVLLNLLANAARLTEQGEVRVTARVEDGRVVVRVKDTGPGIAADKLPHLFEEFYQVDLSLSRKHKGAGLGLAISKRFVEAHDGHIWVESVEGAGSTFSFSLPLPDIETLVAVRPLYYDDGAIADELRPPILVVDADPQVAAMVGRQLDDFRAIQVESLDQLPEQVTLHHPQAVIYNVPPGKRDVEELALPASVPVVECSLPSQVWVADDLRVAAFINKPLTPERLLSQIERMGDIKDVLVVDDDRGFCRLVERMLQSSGRDFLVRRAYDGEDGLRQVRERRPDLLLLDLIMPGKDGFEVLAELQRDPGLAEVPVVLLTATSLAEDVLVQRRGRIVVQRPEGLRPAEVLRCLQALVATLEPHYDERSSPEVRVGEIIV